MFARLRALGFEHFHRQAEAALLVGVQRTDADHLPADLLAFEDAALDEEDPQAAMFADLS